MYDSYFAQWRNSWDGAAANRKTVRACSPTLISVCCVCDPLHQLGPHVCMECKHYILWFTTRNRHRRWEATEEVARKPVSPSTGCPWQKGSAGRWGRGQLWAPSSPGVDPDKHEPALCLSGPSSVKWVTVVLASKDGSENLWSSCL